MILGTLYILPLIIFSGLRSEVREMTVEDINEISMILREVNSTYIYKHVCSVLDTDDHQMILP